MNMNQVITKQMAQLISAFLTTGSVEIADGDELMSVSRLVPDFDNLAIQ